MYKRTDRAGSEVKTALPERLFGIAGLSIDSVIVIPLAVN
jgi:hypothetical protein